MYKKYLVILKKVMNDSDNFFRIASFLMWFSVFFSFLFFVFQDITIKNIAYSMLVTAMAFVIYWHSLILACFSQADDQSDKENILKISPDVSFLSILIYPQMTKVFVKWIFSIPAHSKIYAMVGHFPTAIKLHEKLVQFAGEKNNGKFWLLYETAEALGLEGYLVKRTHSDIVERYALLYALEDQIGPIGRDAVIKKEPYLWNKILNDLGFKLAKKIAKYRTDFFIELCERSGDILEFKGTLMFQKYQSRCKKLLENCSQYHTHFMSYLNSWYGIHQIFPEKENILAQEFIPSGETPKTIRNADGFRIRDFKLVNLKDYFYGIKKTKLNEVY